MKFTLPLLGAALALFAVSPSARAAESVPVIVELFTSEGCSSCPPADRLLSQISKSSPVAGVDVIALGEHVDYWNHGGWADPFSARQFSERQSVYSAVLHLDTVYTPQMIVDGHAQFVGSDDGLARTAIARAARAPKANVQVTQTGAGKLSVSVSHLPASAQKASVEVYLAITEEGLRSSVRGGENAGRRLAHTSVVRQLTLLGTVRGGVFTATPNVAARAGRRHAVVFAQEHTSRRIVGAAQVAL